MHDTVGFFRRLVTVYNNQPASVQTLNSLLHKHRDAEFSVSFRRKAAMVLKQKKKACMYSMRESDSFVHPHCRKDK